MAPCAARVHTAVGGGAYARGPAAAAADGHGGEVRTVTSAHAHVGAHTFGSAPRFSPVRASGPGVGDYDLAKLRQPIDGASLKGGCIGRHQARALPWEAADGGGGGAGATKKKPPGGGAGHAVSGSSSEPRGGGLGKSDGPGYRLPTVDRTGTRVDVGAPPAPDASGSTPPSRAAALAQRTKARFDATFREKRLLKGPRPVRGLPATDPVARLHGGRAVT